MESKVDILAQPASSNYEWERYDIGASKLYTWDKHEYSMDEEYTWKLYPTKPLAKDTYTYLEWKTRVVENCYAKFNLVKPYGVRVNSFHKIADGGIVYGTIDWEWWEWEQVMPTYYIWGVDVNNISECPIDGYVITDIQYFWDEDTIKALDLYHFQNPQTAVKVRDFNWAIGKDIGTTNWHSGDLYWRMDSQEIVNEDEWDFDTIYMGINVGSEINFDRGYERAEIPITKLDAAVIEDLANAYDYSWINNTYFYKYANSKLEAWNYLVNPFGNPRDDYDYIQNAILSGFYVRNKTDANKFINITNYIPVKSMNFGRKPNTPMEFFVAETHYRLNNQNKSVGIAANGCVMMPVNLYDTQGEIENTYVTNSRGLVMGCMGTELLGYEYSTNNQYAFVPTVRGQMRTDESEVVVSDALDQSKYHNKIFYDYVGMLAAGSLVPCVATVTYHYSQSPWGNLRDLYECKDFQFGTYPLLAMYWGFVEPKATSIIRGYDNLISSYIGYKKRIIYLTETKTIQSSEATYLPNRGLAGTNFEYYGTFTIPESFYEDLPSGSILVTDYYNPFEGNHGLKYTRVNTQAFSMFDKYEHSDPVIGAKIGTASSFELSDYPTAGVKNGFYYRYKSYTTVGYGKVGVPTKVYSTEKNAFPKNGLAQSAGNPNKLYWYVYKGPTELVIRTFAQNELLGNAEYTQSAGDSNSFSVGTVGGASVKFSLLKPISEVYPYLNYNMLLHYYFPDGSVPVREGIFTIKEITENGLNKTDVVAYDNTTKLDCQFQPLGSRLAYPISAARLFVSICAYCDIPYNIETEFLNSEATIETAFGDEKTTCRDVMEWIAQIAGCIIVADEKGFLVFKNMKQPMMARGSTSGSTYNLDTSVFPIVKPNAIQYKDEETEEITTITLSEDISPIILDFTDNPFIQNNSNKMKVNKWLRDILVNIEGLGEVYSFEVKVPNDLYEIFCGDSWVVSTNDLTPRRGIISNKNINAAGVTYISSGEIKSLQSEKALSGDAIDDLLDEVDSMFRVISVDRFRLRDTILNLDYKVIDEPYVFSTDNTIYLSSDLSFDIGQGFDSLYYGQEITTVLQDGNIVRMQVINNELIIKDDTYMPEFLVKIEDVIVKNADGDIVVKGSDMSDWNSIKSNFGEWDEILIDGQRSGILYMLNISSTSSPYNRLNGQASKLLYFLADEEVHTLSNPDSTGNYFEIGNVGYLYIETDIYTSKQLIMQYNRATKVLEITHIPIDLPSDITISAINVSNSQDTWTLYDSSDTAVTLPITIPSGTYWDNMPSYHLINEDGHKIILDFNSNFDLYATDSYYYHNTNKYHHKNITVSESSGTYTLTFGQKYPIVHEATVYLNGRWLSVSDDTLRPCDLIDSKFYTDFSAIWLAQWEWTCDGGWKWLLPKQSVAKYYVVRYDLNTQTWVVYADGNDVVLSYQLTNSAYSYDWDTQTLTIDERGI